jgi:hypothetical protein
MLFSNLKEILKYTHGLGFIEVVKIEGSEEGTKVYGISNEKTVVLKGTLKTPMDELAGTTVGLGRMQILNGYLKFPAFVEDPSCVSVQYQDKEDVKVPVGLLFKTKHEAKYRFMSDAVVKNTVHIPEMRDITWDISFAPNKNTLSDLRYFSQTLGSFESTFNVITERKELKLSIGSTTGDQSVIPFASDIVGNIPSNFSWPLNEVITILKLCNEENCIISFSSAGGMQICIDSGMGTYVYVLPARPN